MSYIVEFLNIIEGLCYVNVFSLFFLIRSESLLVQHILVKFKAYPQLTFVGLDRIYSTGRLLLSHYVTIGKLVYGVHSFLLYGLFTVNAFAEHVL
jgi:hypothetical protein